MPRSLRRAALRTGMNLRLQCATRQTVESARRATNARVRADGRQQWRKSANMCCMEEDKDAWLLVVLLWVREACALHCGWRRQATLPPLEQDDVPTPSRSAALDLNCSRRRSSVVAQVDKTTCTTLQPSVPWQQHSESVEANAAACCTSGAPFGLRSTAVVCSL